MRTANRNCCLLTTARRQGDYTDTLERGSWGRAAPMRHARQPDPWPPSDHRPRKPGFYSHSSNHWEYRIRKQASIPSSLDSPEVTICKGFTPEVIISLKVVATPRLMSFCTVSRPKLSTLLACPKTCEATMSHLLTQLTSIPHSICFVISLGPARGI